MTNKFITIEKQCTNQLCNKIKMGVGICCAKTSQVKLDGRLQQESRWFLDNSKPDSKTIQLLDQVIVNEFKSKIKNSPQDDKGLTILKSDRNLSHISSLLHCLLSIKPLNQFFLSKKFTSELQQNTEQFSLQYANLVFAKWSANTDQINLEDFLQHLPNAVLDKSQSIVKATDEILWKLHQELNIANYQFPTIIKRQGNYAKSAKAWVSSLTQNNSIITDLFQGQYKVTSKCQRCYRIEISFENFYHIELPIPNKRTKLLNCFIENSSNCSTQHDIICQSCNRFQRFIIQKEIWIFPPILLVFLKRFSLKNTQRGKILTNIEFPIKDFDLTSCLISEQKFQPIYNAFSIVMYEGSQYSALVKNEGSGSWYRFDNDDIFISFPDKNIFNQTIGIFLYRKTQETINRQKIDIIETWSTVKMHDEDLNLDEYSIN